VFKKYKETGEFDEKEIYPYITEGIGEDILPKNVNFDLIDLFEKVSDKDGAVYTRRLAKEEGIMMGYSAGSAIAGLLQLKDKLTKDDVVVIILHDHGSRYVGKVYNDDWMRERGFLEDELTVKDLVRMKADNEFTSISKETKVKEALELMKDKDISQIPVVENGEVVGSVTEATVLNYLLDSPMKNADQPVKEIMGEAFPYVENDMACRSLNRYINKDTPAVLTKDPKGDIAIITQYDIIQAL
jgi:cystathionine beta-synthase